MATPDHPSKWRVLFDLNVILDVLMRRGSHFEDAARLWALAETGQIEGVVAGHSITTLFYLYRRQSNPQEAYRVIRQLLRVFNIAGVDQQVIELACDLAWRDFEYAVQAVAAKNSGCAYLVTRNPGDFSIQEPRIIHPADLLAIWAGRASS